MPRLVGKSVNAEMTFALGTTYDGAEKTLTLGKTPDGRERVEVKYKFDDGSSSEELIENNDGSTKYTERYQVGSKGTVGSRSVIFSQEEFGSKKGLEELIELKTFANRHGSHFKIPVRTKALGHEPEQ